MRSAGQCDHHYQGIPLKTIKVTADPPSISAALPFGTIRDNAEAALPGDAIRALLPRHREIPGLFRGNPQVFAGSEWPRLTPETADCEGRIHPDDRAGTQCALNERMLALWCPADARPLVPYAMGVVEITGLRSIKEDPRGHSS